MRTRAGTGAPEESPAITPQCNLVAPTLPRCFHGGHRAVPLGGNKPQRRWVSQTVRPTSATLRRFHASVYRWILPPVRPLRGPLCVGASYDFGPGVGVLRVESQLGSGAYGQAFMVRALQHDREVAVKVIDLTRQPRIDVEREVTLQQRCAGAHVISVHHAVFTPTHAYMLMEPADRVSLEERLERLLRSGRDVSVQEALTWFDAMVAAVARCHAQGVIHGDIKPDNFVIARHGAEARASLKLTDFGSARDARLAGEESATASAGTLTHVAPELLRAAPLGYGADMWALGTSLYRMIMGIEPFYDDTPERIAARLQRNQPQFTLDDLARKLAHQGVGEKTRRHVCNLVTMLLQPTPNHRWDVERLRAATNF